MTNPNLSPSPQQTSGGGSQFTPPAPLHQGGGQATGNVTVIQNTTSCQTDLLYSFSPKLCLELLKELTDEQLNFEVD